MCKTCTFFYFRRVYMSWWGCSYSQNKYELYQKKKLYKKNFIRCVCNSSSGTPISDPSESLTPSRSWVSCPVEFDSWLVSHVPLSLSLSFSMLCNCNFKFLFSYFFYFFIASATLSLRYFQVFGIVENYRRVGSFYVSLKGSRSSPFLMKWRVSS